MAKAVWNNIVIAESDDIVRIEGNAYFPEAAVNNDYLRPSEHTSFCPWKGTAHYYSLNVDGAENENAAWYYPDPREKAVAIKNRIAFWKGVEVTD